MKRTSLIQFLTLKATEIGHELLHKEQLAELLPREKQPAARRAIAAGRADLCARFRQIWELQGHELINPGM